MYLITLSQNCLGKCCNRITCRYKPQGSLCQDIQDGECDLPDYCTGTNEWCVEKYKHDGTSCYNRHDAYCYKGKCRSHESQCYFLWGVNDVQRGDNFCFDRNKRGIAIYNMSTWQILL